MSKEDGNDGNARLDIGCVAAHGILTNGLKTAIRIRTGNKPATAFLFELIVTLQERGTVPMIDVRAYTAWLT